MHPLRPSLHRPPHTTRLHMSPKGAQQLRAPQALQRLRGETRVPGTGTVGTCVEPAEGLGAAAKGSLWSGVAGEVEGWLLQSEEKQG